MCNSLQQCAAELKKISAVVCTSDGREPKAEQIMETMSEYNKLTKRLPVLLEPLWKQNYRRSFAVNKDSWASSCTLYNTNIT